MNMTAIQDEPSPIEDEMSAEDFVAQCRIEAAMFPRKHIDDVAGGRAPRTVSRDFVSGSAEHWSEFGELSSLSRPQVS